MMSLTRLSTSGGSVGTNYAYLTARLHASYTTSLLTTGVLRSPKGVGLSFNYSQTAQTAGAAALNSPRAAGLATSATAAVSGSTTNPHSPRNAHTVTTPTHKQNATTTKTWIEDVAAATTPRNLTQLNQKRSMSTATNVAFAPSNPTNALHPEVHPVEQLAVSTTAKQDASYSLEEIMDSVIKVYCTSSSPNYLSPWQNKPIRSQTGSGFVIDGKRIITNAHVVADALQVMVRRPGSPVKYPARVVASGHECDLAVIHVDSDEFWEPYLNHPERVMNISEAAAEQQSQLQTKSPTGLTISTDNEVLDSAPPGYKGLEFCDWIPLLQDDVCVIGYPMGGDNACITQGVVSRVEPVLYAHAATHLLAVQIDAAINPGNSGGPAFVDGKVVGVAFQNIQNANNVGYIIPVPIIRHFLNDVDNGGYKVISQGATSGDFVDGALLETSSPASLSSTSSSSELVRAESKSQRRGFCSLGILCQGTSNATLQRFLGMVPSTVVSKPANGTTSVAAIASSAANAMASVVSYAKGLTSATSPQSTPTSQVQDQNGSSHDVANNSSLSTKDMSRQYATAVQPSSAAGSSVSESSSSAAATTTEAPESTSRFNFVRSALPAAFAHAAPQAQASLFNAGQVTTTSPGNMVPETALSTTGLGLTTSSPTFQLSNDPVTGVLVNKVDIYSPCYGVIQRNDVLVAVDGHPIACDGTVAFRGRERIAFDYLISLKYAGDTARLTFLRRKAAAAASIVDGKTPANATQIELIEKDVAMRPLEHLVSVFEYDKLPSYFVFAGVVCVPLTQPFLHEFGKDWFNSAPRELVQLAVQGSPQFPGQEVVLLAQILPADCTFGYSNIQDLQVKAVNGVRVRNLLHFSRLVERAVLRGAEQYEHELDMKRAAAPQLHSSSEEAARRSELTGVSNSSPFKDYMNKARLSLLPAEDRARLKMRGWDANEVDPDDIDPMPQSGAAIAQSPLAEDPYTIVLELSDHRVLVLDVRAAAQQHTRILATHRVPQDRSEGLGL